MAYNTAPGRAEYTATAGQTVFPFVFKIYVETDIKVYLTPVGQTPDDTADLLTLGTDYTVAITGDSGGSITLLTGATLNDAVTLKRDLPVDRTTEYQTSGDLLATTLNADQNYQTYLSADQAVKSGRHLTLADSVQGVDVALPNPEPLKAFRWDLSGEKIENVTLSDGNFVNTFNSVADRAELLLTTGAQEGEAILQRDIGLLYAWTNTQGTDNGGTIINVGAGSWVAQYDGAVNVKWFGAVGDSITDDTTAIQSAIDNFDNIFIPDGYYNISEPIVLISGKTLKGETRFGSRLIKTTTTVGTGSNLARSGAVVDSYANDSILQLKHDDNTYTYNVVIEDLTLLKSAASAASIGIDAPRTSACIYKNVWVVNAGTGYKTFDSWMTSMVRVTVQGCVYGFIWEDDGTGNTTGTSLDMSACWVNFDNSVNEPSIAYSFFGLHYSSLSSCGADNGIHTTATIGSTMYRVNLCRGMSITGTGCENYRGTALSFQSASCSVEGFTSISQLDLVSGGTKGTIEVNNSAVTLTACNFDAITGTTDMFNYIIQDAGHLTIINPEKTPSGASTFISYTNSSSMVIIEDGVVNRFGDVTYNLDTISDDVDTLNTNTWDAFGTGVITSGLGSISHGLPSAPTYIMARIVHSSDAVLDAQAQVTAKFSASFNVRPIRISTGTADFGTYNIEWWAKI